MNWLAALMLFAGVATVLFLRLSAPVLAKAIRLALPVSLIAIGGILTLLGRTGIGLMAIMGGVTIWRRFGGVGRLGPASRNRHRQSKVSTVRSAALEMELNHETGDMNGLVLAGKFEGKELDQLEQDDLMLLYDEVRQDVESIALLDAYLDRRFTAWRENAHFDRGAGEAGATGAGPMGEKEAYKVLGLAPGAGADEIRKAHRRLMKRAHPDSGGSTFLAAKINEAKDVLLKSHQ